MTDGITVLESTNVLKNFVKMGVSAIAYLRNLFAEHVFEDATIGGLTLKRLTRATKESTELLNWIDYGIYDALRKEYLKTLIVSIHDSGNVILESYTFSFEYTNQNESGNCSVQLSVTSSESGRRPSLTRNQTNDTSSVHKDDIKAQTITVLRDLVLMAQSLSPLPENRFVSMKLLYYEDRVPQDYEPQYFQTATAMDHNVDEQINMQQNVGELKTGFHNMQVQVRSCCYIDENTTTCKTSVRAFDTHPNVTPFGKGEAEAEANDHCPFQNTQETTSGGATAPMQLDSDATNKEAILSLMKRARELAHKSKFISKDSIATGLGIDAALSRALVKKMMEAGDIDIRYVKNKGYAYVCMSN